MLDWSGVPLPVAIFVQSLPDAVMCHVWRLGCGCPVVQLDYGWEALEWGQRDAMDRQGFGEEEFLWDWENKRRTGRRCWDPHGEGVCPRTGDVCF